MIEGRFGENGSSFKLDALYESNQFRPVTHQELVEKHSRISLEGMNILILGGSSGIGSECARLMASLGGDVFLHYFRSKNQAEQIAKEFPSIQLLQADLSNPDDVTELASKISQSTNGSLDALVNCTIGEFSPVPFVELNWKSVLEEVQLSVGGAFLTVQNLLPLLKNGSNAKVIHLSSDVVSHPVGGQTQYSIAKAALEAMTRNIALELKSEGIAFNILSPGMTSTDLIKSLGNGIVRRHERERLLGEILPPIQIAKAITFLCSDWCDGMTGQKFSFSDEL